MDPSRRYVKEKDIRPIPKEVKIGDFSPGDIVDVDVRDGWWVWQVLQKSGELYTVSFNHGTEELTLEWIALRIHQEFYGEDIWVYSKK